jgi:hypothetical protein
MLDLKQVMALIEADEALAERVAALEAAFIAPLISPSSDALTGEQAAEFRERLTEAAGRYEMRLIPQTPPLTPEQIRCLLRECVTVVKPGETLIIRDRNWTPNQVREIQQWMDDEYQSGRIGFKVLAIIGEELGVAEPGGSGEP